MSGMVDKSRSVAGVPTSLKDLGYGDVGLCVAPRAQNRLLRRRAHP